MNSTERLRNMAEALPAFPNQQDVMTLLSSGEPARLEDALQLVNAACKSSPPSPNLMRLKTELWEYVNNLTRPLNGPGRITTRCNLMQDVMLRSESSVKATYAKTEAQRSNADTVVKLRLV